ncbi:MAG: PD-(D/E)XK nuclease family protein [Flavobacteriales bacterium]
MASESSSRPFLHRLADEIASISKQQRLVVVMPNHRSLHVLSARLKECSAQMDNIELFPVDDLMEHLSAFRMMEPEELLVTFYHAYKTVEKKPEAFDQFSKWATPFLADANDVDLYLGDMNSLFHQISEYRETGEQFTKEAGPLELGFRSFWERLPSYYQALRSELDRINLGYRGLIYRKVSEQCSDDNKLKEFFADRITCWVGIIPGNPSEQILLEWIKNNAALETYADTDAYYIDSEHHEAGRMFRSSLVDLSAKWRVDLLGSRSYDFRVHPVSGGAGELFKAKALVETIPEEEWTDTALVLADERVLLPFVEVFAPMHDRLNITAGYSLGHTLIHKFVMAWLKLHAGAIERKGQKLFYHQHIQDLLEFSVVKHWIGGAQSWSAMREKIVKRNMKFVPASWIEEQMKGDLFSEQAHHLIFDWPDNTEAVADRISTVLADWHTNISRLRFSGLEKEALPLYIDRMKQLFSQFNELLDDWDIKALRSFMHRHLGYSKVYFRGTSNSAIQVMGMLETRMVDFKNVIVIGASDDNLPGNPNNSSLIPFVHRLATKLPTRKDSESLISYHFYRLIQRAERVDLIYNTSSAALSGGEASRFILQLEQELTFRNPNARITIEPDSTEIAPDSQRPLRIEKTSEVIEALKKFLSSNVSPSALNKFINSPLEFYFYYVLKVKEQEKVEEEMESNTFGSVVHDVLEQIYLPFKGSFIDMRHLEACKQQVDSMVEKRFQEDFDDDALSQGKNLIQVNLAKRYVKTFIEYDLQDMSEKGVYKILEIENRLAGYLDVDGINVGLMGFADRIDWRDGITRIVDYKTGKVEPADISAGMLEMFTVSKYSKALQLAFYKWAYMKREQLAAEKVESCIYSFRRTKNGMIRLMTTNENFNEEFEMQLKRLIQEMLNPIAPFEHKPESKYVTF